MVLQRAMKRVAVFGNAGAGKSTVARRLAEITGLPLCVLDKVQFREGGEPLPYEEYLERHSDLLAQDAWIIDGYGDAATTWERLAAADTFDSRRSETARSLLASDKTAGQGSFR